MKKPKRKIDYHEHDTPKQEELPENSSVASATECTGLMYRTPLTSSELESYQQLSPMETPSGEPDMKDSVQYKLHRSRTVGQTRQAVAEASGEACPQPLEKK